MNIQTRGNIPSQMDESHVLEHREACVRLSPLKRGGWRLAVDSRRKDFYISRRTCETSYPPELIQMILDTVGPAYLCDEILRDESPQYVQNFLYHDLLAYLDEDCFKHKTLLDFGCGSGASTMVLARMFPDTQIIGVELEERLLSVARAREEFYGSQNVELLLSPSPQDLPPQVMDLDFVVLSGVYEHLLPKERRHLLPSLWDRLKPGGTLFINQTPHRGFPIEIHTTGGLPLLNYLPDSWAHLYVRKCSRKNMKNGSWERILRMGVRGGTVKEILGTLKKCSPRPLLLEPSRMGLKDRIDLWRMRYQKTMNPWIIESFYYGAKILKLLTGIALLPNLSLAIQKPEKHK